MGIFNYSYDREDKEKKKKNWFDQYSRNIGILFLLIVVGVLYTPVRVLRFFGIGFVLIIGIITVIYYSGAGG